MQFASPSALTVARSVRALPSPLRIVTSMRVLFAVPYQGPGHEPTFRAIDAGKPAVASGQSRRCALWPRPTRTRLVRARRRPPGQPARTAFEGVLHGILGLYLRRQRRAGMG